MAHLVGDPLDGIGGHAGARFEVAHGFAADLLRRASVSLHEGRRHRQSVRHVVESATPAVGRQEFGNIHFDAEQIPDRVAVLGSIDAVQIGRADVRLLRRSLIDSPFEPRCKGLQAGRFGPGGAYRRHHAGPHFADHPLDLLGVLLRMRHVHLSPGKISRHDGVVVAPRTEFVNQRTLRFNRLAIALGEGNPREQDQETGNQHAFHQTLPQKIKTGSRNIGRFPTQLYDCSIGAVQSCRIGTYTIP